jgi:hypothetical protein
LQGQSGNSEDKAGSSREGSGAGFLDSLREGAENVVADARQAFFAEATTTTVAATTAAAATTTAAAGDWGGTDPTAYATQYGMTVDQAKSQLTILNMIKHAQIDLDARLDEISADMTATDVRAQLDLKAVNSTAIAAATMPIMASNAAADVSGVNHSVVTLTGDIYNLTNKSTKDLQRIMTLEALKNSTNANADAVKNIAGGKARVQANLETFNALIPRLKRLERRLAALESKLDDGNVTRVVDDTAKLQVTNLIEDVSRAFGRFLPNPSPT